MLFLPWFDQFKKRRQAARAATTRRPALRPRSRRSMPLWSVHLPMKKTYRRLQAGEIIQAGDEVDACRDPWRDDPVWIQTKAIGKPAPDPRFPAHRQYRRRVDTRHSPLTVRANTKSEARARAKTLLNIHPKGRLPAGTVTHPV